jgi:DNA invertase Pin-like site-specific DNA recombinase
MPAYVAYYRRSTARQDITIEAQAEAVRRYVGDRGSIVASFTETESGKRKDRPELLKALDHCKRHKAVLCIAKLDHLARNVAFIANLMDSGVEFVAVDFPQANRLTLHILAAVAEHEAIMISERTKTALQTLKRSGPVLGNVTNLDVAQAKGRAAQAQQARERAQEIVPIIQEIQAAGLTTLEEMATALNRRGYKTARGKAWHKATVMRVLQRAGTSRRKVQTLPSSSPTDYSSTGSSEA